MISTSRTSAGHWHNTGRVPQYHRRAVAPVVTQLAAMIDTTRHTLTSTRRRLDRVNSVRLYVEYRRYSTRRLLRGRVRLSVTFPFTVLRRLECADQGRAEAALSGDQETPAPQRTIGFRSHESRQDPQQKLLSETV